MMENSSHGIDIVSLNVEGLRRNDDYVKLLLRDRKPDFICLQETWLSDYDLAPIRGLCDEYGYCSTSKAGVDCSDCLTSGRVPGGVCILYKCTLDHAIKVIVTDNRRLCAISVQLNASLLLLLNLYMPVDTQSNIIDPSYECVLDEVEGLLHSIEPDDVILCGDLNTDFGRDDAQTKALQDFIERNDLRMGWHSPHASQSHTYVNMDLNHFSCIDHFMLNDRLFVAIDEVSVARDPLNMSYHLPVILRLNDQLTELRDESKPTARPRANWVKAQGFHKENYQA